jgi:ribose-phosphate pyrophosphokinase
MAMPGNEKLAGELAARLGWDLGHVAIRQFPDGETYLRLPTSPAGRAVALVCTLDHPNDKLLSLLFAAATARELQASKVGLVSPYLAYMRQDRRFKPGEAVTSRQVAHLLSGAFDWLVTVDPHLHRYSSLAEIYSIPTRVIHAAPLISQWIRMDVADPFIIGPDSESEQWVAAVANDANAPHAVLEKIRHGDRNVEIKLGDLDRWKGRTPVLVDDIISSGTCWKRPAVDGPGMVSPVCIAVHGCLPRADGAAQAGARVVTSNSVPHATNDIDLTPLLADASSQIVSREDSSAGQPSCSASRRGACGRLFGEHILRATIARARTRTTAATGPCPKSFRRP